MEDCCSGVENKNKYLKLKDPSCSAWICCFVASETSIRKSEECCESWVGILISKVFDFSRGRESQILTNFSLNKSCQNRSRRPEFSPSSSAEFRCVQWPNCPAARGPDNGSSSKGQSQPSLSLRYSHTPPVKYGQRISIALISLLQFAFLSKPNILYAAQHLGAPEQPPTTSRSSSSTEVVGSGATHLLTSVGELLGSSGEPGLEKYRNHSCNKNTWRWSMECHMGQWHAKPLREPTRCS